MSRAFFQRPLFEPLARRDFRLLLAGSLLVSATLPVHLLTQVFWVNHSYPERAVLYAGILAASRGASMVLFSLIGGVIADQFERRAVLFVCATLALAAHAVVAALMLLEPFGEATVAAVALWTFIAGSIQSIDSPARQASIPTAAGMQNVPAAVALLSISQQIVLPLSLPVVGILNDVISPGAVYALSLLTWAGILPLILMLRFRSTGGATGSNVLANAREGLGYVRRRRALLAIVTLVLTIQVIGFPVATPLGPMFYIEVLHFTPTQVGFMGMAWGVGSLAASLSMAQFVRLPRRGVTLAVVALTFGIALIIFGHSRWIPLTAVSNFTMGFSFTATSLVAITLTQILVDDRVRGRVLSLFPFSHGLAQLGTAGAGAIGGLVGLAILIPVLGWAAFASCALIILLFREFLPARAEPTTVEEVEVGPGARPP